MKLTFFRVVVLAVVLLGGWLLSGAQGNQQAQLAVGALTMLIAGILVTSFIIVDYRERERLREQEVEEKMRQEIEKLK